MVANSVEARWRQQAIQGGLEAIEKLVKQDKLPKKYAEPVKTRASVRQVHQVRQLTDALRKLAGLPAVQWSLSGRDPVVHEHLELTGDPIEDARRVRAAEQRARIAADPGLIAVEIPELPELEDDQPITLVDPGDVYDVPEDMRGVEAGQAVEEAQHIDPRTGLLAPKPVIQSEEDADDGSRYEGEILTPDQGVATIKGGDPSEADDPVNPQGAGTGSVATPQPVTTGQGDPEAGEGSPDQKPAPKRSRPRSYVAGEQA